MDDPPPTNVIHLERIRPTNRALRALVGESALMQSLRADTERFAPSTAPVVIEGESGTGKELVARALHADGPRRTRPFVAANVAAIEPTLLGSELFGHVQGAFTGAHRTHRGLFEQADGGTLFLDEIAEASAAAQASLLRVLETGELRPVGGEGMKRVSVRLIVASHENLSERVAQKRFRSDLLYRLRVLVLRTPSLRARPEDIPEIADAFFAANHEELGPRTLRADAEALLRAARWPGNVRQLQNVLRRAAVQSDLAELGAAEIAPVLAAEDPGSVHAGTPPSAALLRAVLVACGGRIATAARKLGVARSTLRAQLKRAGVVVACASLGSPSARSGSTGHGGSRSASCTEEDGVS